MLSLFGDAVSAAYHVVSALALVLAPVTGGLATAAAIVVFTMAVRLLLLPLSYYSIRGQAAQARLLPQVQELQKRHAAHPDRLQRDLATLQAREGAGLLAGLPPGPAAAAVPQRFVPAVPVRHDRRPAQHPAQP